MPVVRCACLPGTAHPALPFCLLLEKSRCEPDNCSSSRRKSLLVVLHLRVQVRLGRRRSVAALASPSSPSAAAASATSPASSSLSPAVPQHPIAQCVRTASVIVQSEKCRKSKVARVVVKCTRCLGESSSDVSVAIAIGNRREEGEAGWKPKVVSVRPSHIRRRVHRRRRTQRSSCRRSAAAERHTAAKHHGDALGSLRKHRSSLLQQSAPLQAVRLLALQLYSSTLKADVSPTHLRVLLRVKSLPAGPASHGP